MQARRKQTPISIRSDRAAARLRRLATPGRSQADIIEDALDRMPLPEQNAVDDETWYARLDVLTSAISKQGGWTMKEFDAIEYDENGNLRDY